MTTRHRKRIREASIAIEQGRSGLKAGQARLEEVGRVLSSANEDKLRTALAAITDVLSALEGDQDGSEAGKEARSRALRLAEAYSAAAADAGTGAWIVSSLLDLMSAESDEPDELAVLNVAFQALSHWVAMEVASIGSPDDVDDSAEEMSAMASWGWGWEAMREALDRRLRNKAIAVHHTATDEGAWDGAAAEKNLSGDASEAELRGAYAWQDPDADAATKAAYKFPHHDVGDDGKVGAANTKACSSAIGILNGGRGGADIPDSDRQGVYNHLAAHLKDAGMEAPELQEAWAASRARLADAGGLQPPIGVMRLREGRRMVGDLQPLLEASVREDGTTGIKLIAPGWGSTGYYSPEVLEDGASVFPAGTKMFWDHPTLSEEWERPERSLRDLAAELITDAVYKPDGSKGPGLYADAKVFSPYREVLNEIGPSIGVSIVAYGRAESGTAEGKSGQIITDLVAADSVDFVTYPGAGGQVLSLFESARQRLEPTTPPAKEAIETMTDVEKDPKFVEVSQRAARAEEKLVLREAKDLVAAKLAETTGLPEITRKRLEAVLSADPPAKAGALDVAALEKKITEAVDGELEYLAGLTKAGQIRGMGAPGGTEGVKAGELEAAFQGIGLSEAAAKRAAAGR